MPVIPLHPERAEPGTPAEHEQSLRRAAAELPQRMRAGNAAAARCRD